MTRRGNVPTRRVALSFVVRIKNIIDQFLYFPESPANTTRLWFYFFERYVFLKVFSGRDINKQTGRMSRGPERGSMRFFFQHLNSVRSRALFFSSKFLFKTNARIFIETFLLRVRAYRWIYVNHTSISPAFLFTVTTQELNPNHGHEIIRRRSPH